MTSCMLHVEQCISVNPQAAQQQASKQSCFQSVPSDSCLLSSSPAPAVALEGWTSGLSPPSSECLRFPFVNSREAGLFPAGSSGGRDAAQSTVELKTDPCDITNVSPRMLGMDHISFCSEMFRAGGNIHQMVSTWHCSLAPVSCRDGNSCHLRCSQAKQVPGLDADLAEHWRCWAQRGPGLRLETAGS